MHFSSALAIVAAAATAAHAFALPASIGTAYSAVAFNITERDLATRSCKRLDPSLVLSYFQEHPTWNAWGTAVSKKAGSGQASITGRTALAFSGIPSGAQGCLLHYALPNNNKQYATGDAHTVNVYGADRAPGPKVCWNDAPRKLQQYSSFNVPTPKNTALSSVLLSVPCDKARKGFLLETGDWQQKAGSVKMPQKPTSIGFWMTYDC